MRKTDRRYTYADYRTWPENERWELIDGVAWDMSPAPSWNHQGICATFYRLFGNYFEGKPCRMFPAPFDVFFPVGPTADMDEVTTVVQPDLTVVCDPNKYNPKGCWGSPDLVVEVLSPWTSQKDLRDKFNLYERSGVREYWVIDPRARYVRVFTLENESYGDGVLLDREGTAESRVFEGLAMDLPDLFKDMLEF